MSKTLIIGNGFDIYHGFPTRYNDFLYLAENWDYFYERYKNSPSYNEQDGTITIELDDGKLSLDSLSDYAKHKNLFHEDKIDYLNKHITSNKWINYFLHIKFNGKGWVDFEAEIYTVLKTIDYFFEQLPTQSGKYIDFSTVFTSDIIEIAKFFIPITEDKIKTNYFGFVDSSNAEKPKVKKHFLYLLEKLKEELDILIECLRLYFLEFVEPLKSYCFSEQIRNLGKVDLLSFNYTNIFSNIYGKQLSKCHFIHGSTQNQNIVLGIPDNSFDNRLEFVYFLKYFQRIQKKTGSEYKNWINEYSPRMRDNGETPNEVFIMGHSLGETDKGVLEYFFKNELIEKITIFYHNQLAYEQMVINLIRMFGKDYVIENISNDNIAFVELTSPSKVDSLLFFKG